MADDELRLVLLLDKSEPWLNYTRKQVLSSWGVDSEDDVTSAESLSVVGTPDLFGDTPAPPQSVTWCRQGYLRTGQEYQQQTGSQQK